MSWQCGIKDDASNAGGPSHETCRPPSLFDVRRQRSQDLPQCPLPPVADRVPRRLRTVGHATVRRADRHPLRSLSSRPFSSPPRPGPLGRRSRRRSARAQQAHRGHAPGSHRTGPRYRRGHRRNHRYRTAAERRSKKILRMFRQAHQQGAVLSYPDVSLLLHLQTSTISRSVLNHERQTKETIPRRGTIHDMGRSITHKAIICHKRLVENKTTSQVATETLHDPEEVEYYVQCLRRIKLCSEAGMHVEEISQATSHSKSLIQEYLDLIGQLGLSRKNNHRRTTPRTSKPTRQRHVPNDTTFVPGDTFPYPARSRRFGKECVTPTRSASEDKPLSSARALGWCGTKNNPIYSLPTV